MGKDLTPRELEVLTWVMRGKTNWETAQILRISQSTVKAHLKHTYQKFGVNNRLGAITSFLQMNAESHIHLFDRTALGEQNYEESSKRP